jgi:hypothetical protein
MNRYGENVTLMSDLEVVEGIGKATVIESEVCVHENGGYPYIDYRDSPLAVELVLVHQVKDRRTEAEGWRYHDIQCLQ